MSKKVKVTRTIVYDYDEIVQSIRDVRGKPDAVISEDEVMDLIDAWVYEDFQSPVTLNLLNMEFVDVATEFINKGEQK
jgi:surfactin synthase thioesterase subunit